MSFEHVIAEQVTTNGRTVRQENTFSGDGQVSRSVEVADSETNMLINFALDVSQIKSIYIKSDQDLTLETNDGESPDNTLNLTANVPYVWHENSLFTNLLTVDITALYATNASGSTATLEIEALVDSTP